MKINWGWGIAIVYSLFVLFFVIVFMVTLRHDNSLVEENYYQQDITYQLHKDKRQNYLNLGKKVDTDFDAANQTFTMRFPKYLANARGEILFYRPSTAKLDYTVELKPDSTGLQLVKTNRLLAGRWKVQVEFSAADRPYYFEEELIVPSRAQSDH